MASRKRTRTARYDSSGKDWISVAMLNRADCLVFSSTDNGAELLVLKYREGSQWRIAIVEPLTRHI